MYQYVSQLPTDDIKQADRVVRELAEGGSIQMVFSDRPSRVIIINYSAQVKKEFDLSVENDCITIEDQAENVCVTFEQCEGLNEEGPDIDMMDPNIYFYFFD